MLFSILILLLLFLLFIYIWTFWNEQTKRTSETFSFRVKRNKFRQLIWLIKLKPRAVKYQSPGFPWYVAHDVPRPWFFLTCRNIRMRNVALSDMSRFLTHHVLISDSPSVEEFHGHVNTTKLLISRSENYRAKNNSKLSTAHAFFKANRKA